MEILNFVDRKCVVMNLYDTGPLISKPPCSLKKTHKITALVRQLII